MTKPHGVTDNIRAEMARRRFSQTDLAGVLGRSQAAVSRRLAGETDFSLREITTIAGWLGVSVSSLLNENVEAGDAA